MEYFDAIKFAIEQLIELVKGNKAKKQEIFESIEAIRQATIETEIFLRENPERPLKPNKALSELWMKTASKVRDKDYEIYDRLLSKADYWGAPENWDEAFIQSRKLQLKDIREASDKLLAELKD